MSRDDAEHIYVEKMKSAVEGSPVRRIAVIGAGALGGYFGVRLAVAGESVAFLLRSDYAAVKAQRRMQLELADGCLLELAQPAIYATTAAIGRCDWVLIGLKTTHNHLLKDMLEPLVGEGTLLITLQNGLGNVEQLAELYPANPVLAALCQIGVNRSGPGEFKSFVPRDGSVLLGCGPHAISGEAAAVQAAFAAAGIHTRIASSLGEALWRKLMWNIPFNGLTVAIGGRPTDAVCKDPALRSVAAELMQELRHAAQACGFAIEADFVDQLLHFTDAMGAYWPSTVLDWQAGRPLEVEAIFRRPLLEGTAKGVKMPHLATLCAILNGLKPAQR